MAPDGVPAPWSERAERAPVQMAHRQPCQSQPESHVKYMPWHYTCYIICKTMFSSKLFWCSVPMRLPSCVVLLLFDCHMSVWSVEMTDWQTQPYTQMDADTHSHTHTNTHTYTLQGSSALFNTIHEEKRNSNTLTSPCTVEKRRKREEEREGGETEGEMERHTQSSFLPLLYHCEATLKCMTVM